MNKLVRYIKEKKYGNMSFGQLGEDIGLITIFGNEFGYNYKGIYVDVGAFHPFEKSNSYWAHRNGWKGINIDPNPETISLFEKFRPNDININCGILNETKNEILKYYVFKEQERNSFDESMLVKDKPIKTLDIQVRKLADIFIEHNINKIDYMNIDAEGKDLEVLKSNAWDKILPTIISIEQGGDLECILKSEIYKFLKFYGYECISNYYITSIYKRKTFLKI